MTQERPLEWVFGARLSWGGVWLNRHYVSRELAAAEDVVYVLDPLPFRPSRRARQRAFERDEQVGEESAPDGMKLVRLPELPLQRLELMKRANHAAGERLVRGRLRARHPVVVVQLPRARLFRPGALGEALTVYYCSDDFRTKRNGEIDAQFCAWEDEMLARADLVIAISDALAEGFAARHPRVRVVENGTDPALFHPVAVAAPTDVASLPRPRVGFVGSVRSPLIDHDMMAELAARRPDWSFCFVGWFDEDDAGIRALRAQRNVHVLGARPREELAAYLGAMDVLTCPYPACRVTAVASPLKVYEAMAVGVPMVALHAPTLDGLAPFVTNTSSPEEFEAALAATISDPPPADPDVIDSVSWAARARRFRGHVTDALADRA